jgi:guanosine-3',5'-bis(diphosphate) 3'-pyrophosphohydrolase
MATDSIISSVQEFATRAHGDQKRKYTPEPYIVHPVRVMKICAERTADPCILSAALLHDVLEDTAVTAAEMEDFLRTVMNERDAARTLKLVVELTDVYIKEKYPRFNRRQRKEMELSRMQGTSADSRTIKYADIIDNCREIVTHDPDFARVFLRECRNLLKKIPGGDQKLYEAARQLVEEKVSAQGRSSGGI